MATHQVHCRMTTEQMIAPLAANPVDGLLLGRHQRGAVDFALREIESCPLPAPGRLVEGGLVDQRLAGDTPPVDAGPAGGSLLDKGNASAEFHGALGRRQRRTAAAKDDQIRYAVHRQRPR